MVKQYEIYWVSIAPTIGSEVKKTKPCVVLSPDELNKYLTNVIIAPLTSTVRNKYLYRAHGDIAGKQASIMLEQLRSVDKLRLKKKIDSLSKNLISEVKEILQKMLIVD